jgi:hypothetical protein
LFSQTNSKIFFIGGTLNRNVRFTVHGAAKTFGSSIVIA